MQSHGVPRSVRPFQGKPPGFGRYPQPEGAIFRLGSRDLPDVLLHSRADTVVRRKVQIGNWCHHPCSTLAGRATQCVHYSEFVSDMNLCPQRLDKLTAPTQAFPVAMLQAQYWFTLRQGCSAAIRSTMPAEEVACKCSRILTLIKTQSETIGLLKMSPP